jgi:hypothetical protein
MTSLKIDVKIPCYLNSMLHRKPKQKDKKSGKLKNAKIGRREHAAG